MNIVKRFINQTVCDVPQVSASTDLPMSSMCFVPGNYVFGGVGYQCDQPGRYVFFNESSPVTQQRLMWNSDVYGLLSGLSWMHVHGSSDEPYFPSYLQTLANACMYRKMRLRCGFISQFAVYLLSQLGLTARVVNVGTNEALNGYDDGHIVHEVYLNGGWRMWDMTNGRYFTDANGNHLSAAEIIAAGIGNCTQVKIDADEKINAELAPSSYFDMAIYGEVKTRTPEQKAAWDARIFQKWSV